MFFFSGLIWSNFVEKPTKRKQVRQQDGNPTIRRSHTFLAVGEAPGDSDLGPPSLESSWQAEDISDWYMALGATVFPLFAIYWPLFARLRPKKRPLRLLGEPPLGQSSPKWEKVTPNSSGGGSVVAAFFRR